MRDEKVLRPDKKGTRGRRVFASTAGSTAALGRARPHRGIRAGWRRVVGDAVSRAPQVALLAVVGLGLALRLWQLGFQPLWWDEGYSTYLATETPLRAVALTSVDIHPPLYYLLLNSWFALTGVGVLPARLLSVALGIAAVPLFWAIAQRLVGLRAGWVATLLFVVAPFQVYYSQEVRMYALLALLSLLAAWALLAGRRWVVALALLAALYTHYYAAFLVAAFAVAVLWDGRRRSETGEAVRHWLAPALGVALGYLPWLLYAGPRLYNYVGGKLVIEADAPMTPLEFPWRHLVAFSLGHLMPSQGWLAPAALIFLGLALAGLAALVSGSREERRPGRTAILLAWLFVPLVGAFVVNLVAPFTDARIERQLIFVALPFEMLVGLGVVTLWTRRSILGAAALVAALGASAASLAGFYTIPRYPNDDYRPILATVAARQGPGDGWLAIYPWHIGYLRAYLPNRRPEIIEVPLTWADDDAGRQAGVAQLLAAHSRLWFPAFQIKGRLFENRLAATLAEVGVPVWNDWFGNTRLWLMAPANVGPPTPVAVQFEDGVRLTSVRAGTEAVPAGIGVVPMILTFEGATDGLRASVQLTGGGAVWGEWDGPLGASVRLGLPVEAGTPPGSYEARMSIYRAENGTPLERLDAGNSAGTRVTLSAVSVTRPAEPLPAAALPATSRQTAMLGARIRFVGATVRDGAMADEVSLLPGDELAVTLFWQAVADGDRDLRVFVQLLDPGGEVRGGTDRPPVEGAFPTSAWQAGDLVRDLHRVPLGADAPPGDYRLIAGIYDPATGERLRTPKGADHIDLGSVTVVERPHRFTAPPVGIEFDVLLGSPPVARLAGATIEWHGAVGEISAGTVLPVTLVWQPQRTPPTRLRAFVQLLDMENQLGGLSDAPPGEAPTTAWVADEYITDTHLVGVRPEARGRYRLIAGLYDPASGARLLTADGRDHVVLGEVVVRDSGS